MTTGHKNHPHESIPYWMTPVSDLDASSVECQAEALPEYWTPATLNGYDYEQFIPVMNYSWLVPGKWSDASEINYRLIETPIAMCAIEGVNTGEVHLAMLGGGMNMSWHVAGAFMVAGYLPPEATLFLPWQKPRTRIWWWVVQGCIATSRLIGWKARDRAVLRSKLKEARLPLQGIASLGWP